MNILDELHEIYSAMTELTSTLRKGFDLHSRQLDRQAEQILRLMDRVERLELVESARMGASLGRTDGLHDQLHRLQW